MAEDRAIAIASVEGSRSSCNLNVFQDRSTFLFACFVLKIVLTDSKILAKWNLVTVKHFFKKFCERKRFKVLLKSRYLSFKCRSMFSKDGVVVVVFLHINVELSMESVRIEIFSTSEVTYLQSSIRLSLVMPVQLTQLY